MNSQPYAKNLLARLKNSLAGLALAIGLIAIVAANLSWVATETRPPHWDMARHLWTSLQYWNLVQHRPSALLEAYFYYPPLIYLVVAPFYALFGISVVAAAAANNVFLVAGTVAVYGIGRRVGGRRTALLGALVFATLPMVATQFKEFQIDGPLACVTAVALWALVRSPDFAEWQSAVALGAALGLGMLTKWTFPGAMALPMLYGLGLAAVRTWRDHRWQRVANVTLALGLALLITYTWYYSHRHQIRIDLTANNLAQAKLEGDPTGLGLAAVSYYGLALLNVQLYVVPLLLFLAGVWRAVTRRRHELLLLMLAVVSTYGFFTYTSNKDARYILPMIPAVVVLATFWLGEVPRRWRTGAQVAVAVYAVATFWAMGFGLPVLPKAVTLFAHTQHPLTLWAQHGYIIGSATHEDWHFEEAMRTARGSSLAYLGPDTIWFNSWDEQYFSTKYDVNISQPPDKAAYVLVREMGSEGPKYGRTLSRYGLPDGTILSLYRAN